MLYLIIVILLVLCMYYVYLKTQAPVDYWKSKKIFHVYPRLRFLKAFFGSKPIFEIVRDGYLEFPDKRYLGSYSFFEPALFVRDLDLIKQITVKDFEHFPDHMSIASVSTDKIFGQNLFSLEGEKWKDMRSNLSPAFTSSKMRLMYVLMQEVAENFANHFYGKANEDILEVEMKNAFAKYTNDVIATCAFGVQCDSLKNEKNEFFSRGRMIIEPRLMSLIRTMIFGLCPKFFEFFKIPIISPVITDFFGTLVKETIAHREKNGVIRPDMIHLLMEARKGQLQYEQSEKTDTGFATVEEFGIGKTSRKLELTDDVITAQVVVFFIAGFDSSSTLLSFLTYHVAIDPDIQNKLHKEIDEVLSGRKSSELSYEEVLKMKYLDQVVSETLRMYPAGFILTRMCKKDYMIKAKLDDEIDFQIDKGTLVSISVIGIHMDPKYFPDPHKFDPDRFSEENKGKIVPGSYLPFGSGPRNCIGSRFALLECKVLVVSLLSRFDFVPIEKTSIPMKFSRSFNLSPKNGVWLGLKRRVQD